MTSIAVMASIVGIPKVVFNFLGMELQINHQKISFYEDSLSIMEMLNYRFPDHRTGIAVAVNQHIIAKTEWHIFFLQPGDDVLVITATQGG